MPALFIMQIPTAQDINPFDDLDGRAACKNFLGKSLEDAEAFFRENSLHYQEDLMWMGPTAFRYYVLAVIRYVRSEAAMNASDIFSCLVSILEFRLECESAELVPIAGELASLLGHMNDHYKKFEPMPDIVPEIDGDVRARVEKLRQIFLTLERTSSPL